jgi:glycosidase
LGFAFSKADIFFIFSKMPRLLLLLVLTTSWARATLPLQLVAGPDADSLTLRFAKLPVASQPLLIVTTSSGPNGSGLVPFGQNKTGSTLFLPFQADHILLVRPSGEPKLALRKFNGFGLAPETKDPAGVKLATGQNDGVDLQIPRSWAGTNGKIGVAAAHKDLSANSGWGRLVDSTDPYLPAGENDRYLSHYLSFAVPAADSSTPAPSSLLARGAGKLRIYQMFPRLFGNTNPNRIPNGTYQQNGCGKFADLNDESLTSLKKLGFDAIWVTGVLRQATTRDYSSIGLPPDDPDLLKGIAGSPYAIRDYFDVCPDYAADPAQRITEFKALLARAKKHDLKIFMDFIPNHVARSHTSVVHPERDFGKDDQGIEFFSSDDFYYLQADKDGPPLRLATFDPRKKEPLTPTTKVIWEDQESRFPGLKEKIDGLFQGEAKRGRVTGDNQNTWQPNRDCWYETIKFNYGYDFTLGAKGQRKHPTVLQPDLPVPNLWNKMDAVLAYWQEMGVDGFRCDVAHIVPSEFWHWALARARERNPKTFFYAECYEGDTRLEVPDANPELAVFKSNPTSLLEAGFDAVYGHDAYRRLMEIYQDKAWANDLDSASRAGFVGDNSVRYAENHDEVRVASPQHWGGHGPLVGRPVSGILFGLSRGPVMVYYGQEVGEPADVGAAGFELDKGRTTFFDYWSVPTLIQWMNNGQYEGGGLPELNRDLRAFYGRLLNSLTHPALAQGNFIPLNPANQNNPTYHVPDGKKENGRWLYSFLRYDPVSKQSLLVTANLHPKTAASGVKLKLSEEAAGLLALSPEAAVTGSDLLSAKPSTIQASAKDLSSAGIPLPELHPLSIAYFDLTAQ